MNNSKAARRVQATNPVAATQGKMKTKEEMDALRAGTFSLSSCYKRADGTIVEGSKEHNLFTNTVWKDSTSQDAFAKKLNALALAGDEEALTEWLIKKLQEGRIKVNINVNASTNAQDEMDSMVD